MVVPETEETIALAKPELPLYTTAKWVESRAAVEVYVELTALRATGVPAVMVVPPLRYPTAKCVESRAAVEVWIESLSLSATEVPGVMVVPAETVETTALTKVVELFRYPTAKCVESRAATEVWGDPTAFRAVGVPAVMVVPETVETTALAKLVELFWYATTK